MDDVADPVPDILNNSIVDPSSIMDNPVLDPPNDSTVGPSSHAVCERPKHSAPEDEFFANPMNPMISSLKDISIFLNSKRRAVRNTTSTVGAAWQDFDESGTYDPNSRAPRRSRPRHPKCPRLEKIDEGGSPIPEKPRLCMPRKGYEFSLPVTLSLKSAKGRAYLQSITPGPEDKEHRFSREHSQSLSRTQGSDHESVAPKRRRRRFNKTQPTRYDGLTLDQLTDGHPQRRGCKACFESGDDTCTLIDQGFEYPCTACRDSSVECELIIPPILKKVCESCKKKRISCSYRNGAGQGVASCEACEEAEQKCVAGPVKTIAESNRINNIIGEPRAPRGLPAPAALRKYVACKQCRADDKRCSLRQGENGPCSRCRKANQKCTFELLNPPPPRSCQPSLYSDRTPSRSGQFPKKSQTLTRTLHNEVIERGSRKLERPKRRSSSFSESQSDYNPLSISIRTSFCHPITFNYILSPIGTAPCSFCTNPFFGLFGHGPRVVQVLPDPGGRNGYEELSGGHYEKGEDYTRMCIACTSSRIMIAVCETHTIGELEVQDVRVFDNKALIASVTARLHGDEEKAKLANEAKWCSICPRPAVYQCCTPQILDTPPISPSSIFDSSIPTIGCGLLLCETCEDILTKIQKSRHVAAKCASRSGNSNRFEQADEPILDIMLRIAGDKSREDYYEYGLRADSEFLNTKGELITRVSCEEGEGEQEENDDDEGWDTFDNRTGGRWGNFRGYMDSLVDKRVEKRMQKMEKDRSGRRSSDVPQRGAFPSRDVWTDQGVGQPRGVEYPHRDEMGRRRNIETENGMDRSRGFGYPQREGIERRGDIGMENGMDGGRRIEGAGRERMGRRRDLDIQNGMGGSNIGLGRAHRDIFGGYFDFGMENRMTTDAQDFGGFERQIAGREGEFGMGSGMAIERNPKRKKRVVEFIDLSEDY